MERGRREGGTLEAEGHSNTKQEPGAGGQREVSWSQKKGKAKLPAPPRWNRGPRNNLSEAEGPDMRPCSAEAGFPQVIDVF